MGPVSNFSCYLGKKIDTPFSEACFLLRGNHRSPRLWAARPMMTQRIPPPPGFARCPWGRKRPPHLQSSLQNCCRELFSPGNRLRKECDASGNQITQSSKGAKRLKCYLPAALVVPGVSGERGGHFSLILPPTYPCNPPPTSN